MRYRVIVTRPDHPVYTSELDADSPGEAVDKVFERESTPEWVVSSGWQDVRVEPVE